MQMRWTNIAVVGPMSLGIRGIHVTCDYLYLMQIILSPGNTTVLVCGFLQARPNEKSMVMSSAESGYWHLARFVVPGR